MPSPGISSAPNLAVRLVVAVKWPTAASVWTPAVKVFVAYLPAAGPAYLAVPTMALRRLQPRHLLRHPRRPQPLCVRHRLSPACSTTNRSTRKLYPDLSLLPCSANRPKKLHSFGVVGASSSTMALSVIDNTQPASARAQVVMYARYAVKHAGDGCCTSESSVRHRPNDLLWVKQMGKPADCRLLPHAPCHVKNTCRATLRRCMLLDEQHLSAGASMSV